MPKRRPKAIPSLKGGVFARDPSASITAVNVDGGVLSWLDVASVIDGVPNPFHLDKFPEGANPGPVIPAVKVYLIFGVPLGLPLRGLCPTPPTSLTPSPPFSTVLICRK